MSKFRYDLYMPCREVGEMGTSFGRKPRRMLIKRLLADVPYEEQGGAGERESGGISYHSKNLRPGDLFFCLRGFKEDGHRFAPEAVRAGAVALVVEEWLPGLPVPQVRVPNSRRALAAAARVLHGHPAARLSLAGITGTNGKTTTAFMLRSIFLQAGVPSGLIGTVQNIFGTGLPERAALTTPESADLQHLLRRAADDGCEWVVMEVSSHALALERLEPADFDLALLLNIRRDHFEFHGSFAHYLAAKLRLAREIDPAPRGGRPKAVIVGADDPVLLEATGELNLPLYTFGLRAGADITAGSLREERTGTRFELLLPGATGAEITLPLPGQFNVLNALAAATAAWVAGVPPAAICAGLEACRYVPGRTEQIDEGQPFAVLVDFAHNPAALQQVLTLGRSARRTLLLFGAEGGKDPGKRPLMGAAARAADYVILTSDNTYDEEPAAIAAQVAEGLGDHPHEVVLDRREAIERAVALAEPGDLLIIAGKGHEQTWNWQGTVLAHDDRVAVRAALARRNGRLPYGILML
jgi:UDP-N-acetylmuramoyl-L-alanyl-D-glutamate--2,6-diaminopimelate ligase